MNILPLVIAAFVIGGVFLTATPVWATPAEGKPYQAFFERAERLNNLPAGILSRMAYQESRYNPNATGASGEVGIMQIIPRFHPNVNPANPHDAIYYAGALIRKYHRELGSWGKALAAYNWGITNVRAKGVEQAPPSTVRYVNAILTDIGL